MDFRVEGPEPLQGASDASGQEAAGPGHKSANEILMKPMLAMLGLGRGQKLAVVMAVDALLCTFSVFVAFALRLGAFTFSLKPSLIFLAVALPLSVPIFHYCGVYRAMLRFIGARSIRDLALATAVYALVLMVIFLFVGVERVPRTVAVIQPIIFFGLAATLRIVARQILLELCRPHGFSGEVKRVMIYGAGVEAQQLAMQMRHEPRFQLRGFFEDDPHLIGRKLDGQPIHDCSRLREVVLAESVDILFLAMPSLTRRENREIVEQLAELHVQVQILPPLREIVDGRVSISALREVKINDLLGRDAVAPNPVLLRSTVFDKVVLVTGAGGSIGSELCRQIIRLGPKQLILAEMSEPALYEIDKELEAIRAEADLRQIEVVPELLNLTDVEGTKRLFNKRRPQTGFHAAAYKHVPLVEANVISGLRNNVLGTFNAASSARAVGVERFILISTDKAVRPTSVMGASKRICELVLQALASEDGDTRFAMVRFGNVLGSSGSVVPLFRRQIAQGGPVTVTDRDVTRYFMTIPEAAQLVIQAGAMAQGGEVFLLDMGQSVKIYDLARTMIHLSGFSVRDEENPGGDIEIAISGLRPGEKLYEELLIGADSERTSHPRISKAHEEALAAESLIPQIEALTQALQKGDAAAALTIMRLLVPQYRGAQAELAEAGLIKSA